MKPRLLLMMFFLISSLSWAQTTEISGTVVDANTGSPIPGANIKVKGSTLGTSTDFDGKFRLSKVANDAILLCSYIGYQDLSVAAKQNLTIRMAPESKSLNEVVVIGYGTQKKKQVTGAVSVVDSKTLDALKPVKVEQALQGTVAGVMVTNTSGAPGAGLDIRIRGVGTNGQNGPTVIIDGYVGELGLLNPNDIESLTVLKDAQAAIYGTIGANGIVLVTTKTGKKNSKPKGSFNTYTGFQETSRKLNMLDATEYALLLNESYAAAGLNLPYPVVNNLGKGTNWQDLVFSKSAPIVSHDLSVNGGSEKITYALSGSYLDQKGIVGGDKSGFLRNTARLALGADLSENFKVKTNVIYTYFTRKTLTENVLGSSLFNALNVPATLNPYDANGNFTQVPSTTGFGNEIINPLAQIENTYNDYSFKKVNGNLGFDYKLFDGFTLSSSIGFNTSNSNSKNFAKEVNYGNSKVFNVPRSAVTQGAVNDNNYSFDLYGTYNKKFDKHDITGTLGTTVFKEFGNGLFATGFDVPNNSWEYADIALANGLSDAKTTGSYGYDERRLSYFGRLQYAFDSKYLFSAMFRRDASTKFGPDFRVGYFPSFTAGWVVSEEKFLKDAKWIDFLKFRASYGTLGNDQIPNNGYLSLLSGEGSYVFNGQVVTGTALGQTKNEKLKWEESQKLDFGLDLRFLDNKLSIVADYFRDERKDLLIQNIPVSGINGASAPGASSPTMNAGTVRNSGVEFAIDYKSEKTGNFSYSVGYNVTLLKNKVTEVNNGTGFLEGGSFGVGQPRPTRMEVGHEMGYFYGYKMDGIFQNQAEVDAHPSQLALGAAAKPGDIRFVDINNDGVIDAKDRTDLGSPVPAALMGFNLNLNYKNIDFSVYTTASLGNEMVRNFERNVPDANRMDYVLDRWTGEGSTNATPRVTLDATANNVFSDYFVEDASYLRIQNVQLGYSIPQSLCGKIGISKLRLYASANNLYTFTKYKGFDPAASSGAPIGGGIDHGFYPSARTYMLGLNLNF